MITREYKTVLKLSGDRAALENAHNTPINKDEVERLVYHYLTKCDVKEVRYACRNGNAAANWKQKWLRFDPNALTLGLTLHEIAHIAAFKERKIIKGGRGVHGLHFIRKLDELIKIENEAKR